MCLLKWYAISDEGSDRLWLCTHFISTPGDSLVLLAQQEHLTFSHQPHGRRRLLSQVSSVHVSLSSVCHVTTERVISALQVAQLLSVDANFGILRHHLALPHVRVLHSSTMLQHTLLFVWLCVALNVCRLL